jgi:hypothetical protein
VILILAESYTSSRAYALNMTFDLVSNKLMILLKVSTIRLAHWK